MIIKSVSTVFAAALFLIAGCSRQPEEMSTVRPKLVLEIMKLTKQEKYDEAYIQVKKLQDLDPGNSLLPVLEETAKNNDKLQKINHLLSQNKNPEEAVILLKHYVSQQAKEEQGKNRQAAAKLQDVMRMDDLTDLIINPKPEFKGKKGFRPASKVLKDSIEEFVRLSQRRNISSKLRNKVIRRMAYVSRLRKEESERAVLSLELFAPGLPEHSYQTIMAVRDQTVLNGTKRK